MTLYDNTRRSTLTLYELSQEYEQTAETLRRRITQLEQASREADGDQDRLRLEGRIRPLRSMYRDVRAVARHLGHYYEKYQPRQGAAAGRRGRI